MYATSLDLPLTARDQNSGNRAEVRRRPTTHYDAAPLPRSRDEPPRGPLRPWVRCPRIGPVHPLATVIEEAERGRFPKPDGGWSRAPIWRSGLEAVVAFTAHAVFCLGDDIADDRLGELGADGYGGAQDPRLITAIAGSGSHIGSVDLLFVARARAGAGRGTLVPRPDLLNHPRVRYAANFRDVLDVYGFDDPARSAVAVMGRGIAGLHELSIELEPDRRGRGEGRSLAEAALALLPRGSLIVACVAPGNAASVRSFLHASFTPIGSIQLLQRQCP